MIATDDYICPACRAPVERRAESFACAPCGRDYPILFGIPDFRLKPDRYLSLAEERAKAARLFAFGEQSSFAELVEHYYAITDDVPPALARVFAGHVYSAPDRARAIVAALGPAGADACLLDLGCGSGGAMVADLPGIARRVGVDVALRWLVIARKRLLEAGKRAELVCADVEALPFRPAGFSHVLAEDLLEHVEAPAAAIAAAAGMVAPGGRLWIAAANRWWAGPHPATGIWAAGFMPRALRSRVARRWRGGTDVLRNAAFVSAGEVASAARRVGLEIVALRPRTIDPALVSGRSRAARSAITIYRALAQLPGARQVLLAAGPAFEAILQRSLDSSGEQTCVLG